MNGEASPMALPFQARVAVWLNACFGLAIAKDPVERNHRFLEEALELAQACGCTRSEAAQLVDYVFDRPIGEIHQEIGGVMVCLAALCAAHGREMSDDGETELSRVWTKIEKIRAKQAAKPKHSPLPEAKILPAALTAAASDVLAERKRQQLAGGYGDGHDDLHDDGAIAAGAAAYAFSAYLSTTYRAFPLDPLGFWPWEPALFKPRGARRDLVRAGALILAEIERLDRQPERCAR